MARNWKYGNVSGGVTLALPVPANSEVGDLVQIGTDGLVGYMLTPRATTATIAAFTAAPGLADGEASVRLVNVDFVIEVDITGEVAIGDVVYTDGEGDYGAAVVGFQAGFAVTAAEDDLAFVAVTTTPAVELGS